MVASQQIISVCLSVYSVVLCSSNESVVVIAIRRHLPPPLPSAVTSDKAEYVNGIIVEPVRRTSSLDCLNNPSSSSSTSLSSSSVPVASASVDSAATGTSLTDAGQ